jgi:hypothetical protein
LGALYGGDKRVCRPRPRQDRNRVGRPELLSHRRLNMCRRGDDRRNVNGAALQIPQKPAAGHVPMLSDGPGIRISALEIGDRVLARTAVSAMRGVISYVALSPTARNLTLIPRWLATRQARRLDRL